MIENNRFIDDDGDFYGEIPGQLDLFGLAEPDRETLIEQATKEQLRLNLDEQRKANAERYRDLVSLKRLPDPINVVMTRLNVLLDLILDEQARMRLEINFEAEMADHLDLCLTQARQMALLEPDSKAYLDGGIGQFRTGGLRG